MIMNDMKKKQTNQPTKADVTLDLRAELSRAPEPWEPLLKILWTASQLQTGQGLRVIAPFEPVLLIQIMAAQGFTHRTTHRPAGDWKVVFQAAEPQPGEAATTPVSQEGGGRAIELNFRGLKEPPPMAKVIEALLQLPGKPDLILHTDARPVEETLPEHCRCVVLESELQADGSFKTRIQMPKGAGNR